MAANGNNPYRSLTEANSQHHETPANLEFSSYYSATIFMFVIASTGVALAVIPLLLFNDNESETSQGIYELLRSLCFIALTFLSCFLYWYKRRRISQGSWSHTNTPIYAWFMRSRSQTTGDKEHTTERYMMFTLVVFGVGSIIWCIVKLVQSTPSSNSFDYIENSLNIICLCAQLVFFFDYISEKLPNSSILHYSISAMIGIKMWSWIGAILEPLWDMDDFNDVNITEGTEGFLEFSEEFFEPFYVEFSTIAVGVLFSIWHSMKKSSEVSSNLTVRTPSVQNLDEYLPDMGLTSSLDMRQPTGLVHNKKVIITIASITGIIFTVVSSLATVDAVIPDLTTRVYIYRGVTVLFFAPLVILAMALLFKLSSLPSIASSFLNSNEYVLLFTACSESIYYLLRAVAAIGYLAMVKPTPILPSISNFTTPYPSSSSMPNLPTRNPNHVYNSTELAVLFLVYSIVKFSEAWLQSRLLIVARRKQVPDYVKYCLTFFVAINLSEWLKSGILLGLGRKHRSNFNPMMDAFYGPDETIIIILILLPIMIFFRFHAAIVALEIINES